MRLNRRGTRPDTAPYGLLVRVGVDHPAVTTMEVAAEPDVFSS